MAKDRLGAVEALRIRLEGIRGRMVGVRRKLPPAGLVRPGEARLSPLLQPARHAKMPLAPAERRTLIEWIDMGAHWNSPPAGGKP